MRPLDWRKHWISFRQEINCKGFTASGSTGTVPFGCYWKTKIYRRKHRGYTIDHNLTMKYIYNYSCISCFRVREVKYSVIELPSSWERGQTAPWAMTVYLEEKERGSIVRARYDPPRPSTTLHDPPAHRPPSVSSHSPSPKALLSATGTLSKARRGSSSSRV